MKYLNSPTLPGLTEEVMRDVVADVAEDVKWLIESFMPDGRPFGMEKRSEAEQLEQYLADGLHDNPEAAANWIRAKIEQLIQMMRLFGVPDDKIISVHPYDIVETAGFVWSGRMENLLRERAALRVTETGNTTPPVLSDELGQAQHDDELGQAQHEEQVWSNQDSRIAPLARQ